MTKLAGVYVIFGPLGAYVGQSTDMLQRGSVVLARELGLDWTIVKHFPPGCSKKALLVAEREIARGYRQSGMTVVSTHVSPLAGKRHSDATKIKMSLAHRGKPLSAAHREKLSAVQLAAYRSGKRAGFYGHHHTAEHKAKMSALFTGRRSPFSGHRHTAATKAKFAAMPRGKHGRWIPTKDT